MEDCPAISLMCYNSSSVYLFPPGVKLEEGIEDVDSPSVTPVFPTQVLEESLARERMQQEHLLI